MKVIIYIYDHVPLMDFVVPYELLRELDGVEVTIASKEAGVVKTAGQITNVMTHHSLLTIEEADVLWVCGGRFEIDSQCDDPEVIHALYRLSQRAQVTIGVAEGALLLGKAGILKDVKATTLFNHKGQLKKMGAKIEKQAVVLDGKIITADSHGHSFSLALSLVQLLFDQNRAAEIKEDWGFVPSPPYAQKAIPTVGFKANKLHKKLFDMEKKVYRYQQRLEKDVPRTKGSQSPRENGKEVYHVTFYLYNQMRAMDYAVCSDALRHFPATRCLAVADKRGPITVEGGGFDLIAPHAIQEVTRTHFMVIGGGEEGVITESSHAYLMHWLLKVCPTAQRVLTISDGVRYLGISGILTEYEAYIDPNKPLMECKFMLSPGFSMALDAMLMLAKKHHGDGFAKALQRFVIYGDIEKEN